MDNAEHTEPALGDKMTKKKDKVRSAWISFAGRIVAQIVGAIATVALGVMVLHRYTSTDTQPPARELGRDTYAQPATPPAASAAPLSSQAPVHVIVLTPGMLGLGDGAERFRSTDRGCTPVQERPAASAAHLDNGTFLSR